MKNSQHAKRTALVAAVLSTLGPTATAGAAQLASDIVYQSYGAPVRSGAMGTCVRTGFWTPGPGTGPCGEEPVASNPSAQPAQSPAAPDTAAQGEARPQSAETSQQEQRTQAVPVAPPPKSAQSEPPPQAKTESVPEFVSEPEPADMVPTPPMTAATDEDQRISPPTLFYDEQEEERSSSDELSAPQQNPKFSEDVAAAEADMARREEPPAPPPAAPPPAAAPPATPEITANAVQQAAVAAQPSAHLTLNGETYFGFDKYQLSAGTKEKIDALLADLSSARYDSILLTGHADRIGSDAYNDKLSEHRALAVKRYLGKKGVGSEKVETKWVGSKEPATAPGACEGMSRKKTIVCLAPDRRVELEVVGMRQK